MSIKCKQQKVELGRQVGREDTELAQENQHGTSLRGVLAFAVTPRPTTLYLLVAGRKTEKK